MKLSSKSVATGNNWERNTGLTVTVITYQKKEH